MYSKPTSYLYFLDRSGESLTTKDSLFHYYNKSKNLRNEALKNQKSMGVNVLKLV
jgi:hypothetical protein